MTENSRSNRRSGRHPEHIEFARDQRKSANEFSQNVWQMLRGSRLCGQKFRREHPIPPYTVDFVSLALKLIIEVDGKDHLTDDGIRHDQVRDRFLRQAGYEVLRFGGFEVTKNLESVKTQIEAAINKRIEP